MPPKVRNAASHRSALAAVTLSAADVARLLDGVSPSSVEGPQPATLLAEVARLTHRPDLGPQENAGRQLFGLLKLAAAAKAAVLAALALAAAAYSIAAFPQDEQNLRRLAVSALEASVENLSKALRRQDIVAYATALEEDCLPVIAFSVMSMATAFQMPYETVLSHLHPALPACLRSCSKHEGKPSQRGAADAESAARLALSAAAAGELPDGCEAALVALTQRCTEGVRVTLVAKSAEMAAGGEAELHATISQLADGCRFEIGGWKSIWAAPLTTALRALAPTRPKPQRCPSSAADAAAVVAVAEALIAHELSPLRSADDADPGITAGILAPLMLAGAAAEPVQQRWQAALRSALEEAAGALPSTRSDASFTPAAAGAVLRLSALIAAIFDSCSNGCPCLLTDAGSPWPHFGDALAAAFARVAALLTWQGEHGMSIDTIIAGMTAAGATTAEGQKAEDVLFLASLHLVQITELVLAAVPAAGGLSALEQPPLPALLHPLHRFSKLTPEILQRAMTAEDSGGKAAQGPAILQRFRRWTAALEAAAEVILSAAEQKSAVPASDELLDLLAHSMSALLGSFSQNRGIQNWLDGTRQRRTPAPDCQPQEALQRAAELCSRLLRAFGGRGARLLDRFTTSGDLAVTLSVMTKRGVAAATVAPIKSVCAAMAALLRLSDEAKWQLTSGAQCRRMSWEAAAADVRQALQHEPKARRQMCERALQEVEAALQQVPAAAGSNSPTAGGAPRHNVGARTEASADEAMRALLAEEEAAAPKPSKAAQRRARKKAAAASQAAPVMAPAAPAAQAEGLAAAGPPPPATGAAADSPAAAAAPETAGPAASSSAKADDGAAPDCSAGPQAAPQQQISITASTEPGRSDAGGAAGSLEGLSLADGAAEADHQWMVCPISKVIMADPVVCVGDGWTYERRAITAWLETHATSPVSGQPLESRDLISNFALRSMIQAVQGGC